MGTQPRGLQEGAEGRLLPRVLASPSKQRSPSLLLQFIMPTMRTLEVAHSYGWVGLLEHRTSDAFRRDVPIGSLMFGFGVFRCGLRVVILQSNSKRNVSAETINPT